MKGNENEQDHIADFNLVETLKQREEKQQRTALPDNALLKGIGISDVFFLNM